MLGPTAWMGEIVSESDGKGVTGSHELRTSRPRGSYGDRETEEKSRFTAQVDFERANGTQVDCCGGPGC